MIVSARALAVEAVQFTGLREAHLQLIMIRGRPPIDSRDVRLAKNNFFLFCVPYISIATPEQQEDGLHLIVSDIQRIPPTSVDPTIKTYRWLDFEMGLFGAYDRGGDTIVLTERDGNVTEGPGFNLFAVKDGKLPTPNGGCLDGMTRDTVFELAAETNLDCIPATLPADDPCCHGRTLHLQHRRRADACQQARRPADWYLIHWPGDDAPARCDDYGLQCW